MSLNTSKKNEENCLNSFRLQPGLFAQLQAQIIIVAPRKVFISGWIAELVVTINNRFDGNISLELLRRLTVCWVIEHPRLCSNNIILRA